jgi:superfamily II DNA/RNA helicase
VQVVVATPLTLGKLMRWGAVPGAGVRTVVVDEADAVLARFADEVREVFSSLTAAGAFAGQVVVVSATVSADMLATCAHFVRADACVELLGAPTATFPESLAQHVVSLPAGTHTADKLDMLPEVVDSLRTACGGSGQVLVFANTAKRVEEAAAALCAAGVRAEAMHGQLPPRAREDLAARLASGAAQVVVTTDVMARGVDAQGVAGVVNFDVPKELATYVHRVGRAGRFGRRGVAVTLVEGWREQRALLADVAALLPGGGADLREWRW